MVNWKKWKQSPAQGVVKRDWTPTGRIDFAARLDREHDDQPNEFKLIAEERRIVESIAGSDNLEIRWRLATLNEAKAVVSQYHQYLSGHSLIKSAIEKPTSLPPPMRIQNNPDSD